MTRSTRTGQSRTGQSRTGQSRTGQSRTGQSRTGQSRNSRGGNRRPGTQRTGDAGRRGRDAMQHGVTVVKGTMPRAHTRPGSPVVFLDGDVTVLAAGRGSVKVSGRTVDADPAAARALGELHGEWRWLSHRGAVAQAAARELGMGLWPMSTPNTRSEYGTLANEDVTAQLDADPGRPVAVVASADWCARQRDHVEAHAARCGASVVVIEVGDHLDDTHLAAIAAVTERG